MIESDFIIDLFEFKSNDEDLNETSISSAEVEQTIEEVAQGSGRSADQIRKFVSHYHPASRILRSPKDVTEQFLAFDGIDHSNDIVIRWIQVPEAEQTRVTISVSHVQARDVFQLTAEFLAKRSLDIYQAFLHDIPADAGSRIAIASFLVSGSWKENGTLEETATELADFIRQA